MSSAGIRKSLSERERLRAQLAIPFDGYDNPAKPVILGLRGAYLRHGIRPEGAMAAWLEWKQPPGMQRLPVPKVDRQSAWLFRRLVAERDALPDVPAPQVMSPETLDAFHTRWLRLSLTAALNEIPLQMVDPLWGFGPKFVDIRWPNHIDLEFTQNVGAAEFFSAAFAARSNFSYLIAMGDDDRVPASLKWAVPEPDQGTASGMSMR